MSKNWEIVGKLMMLNLENSKEQYSALGYTHRTELALRCPYCRIITFVDSNIRYDFCPHCGESCENVY